MQTNAPASMAGLRTNDFVLEIDHRPVRSLRELRLVIDRSGPGATVTVKACRDGEILELPVVVGKETYRQSGCLSVVFPSVVHGWHLWLNPGFSFVFAGYEPNPGLRPTLGKANELYVEDWKAFAAIFELSSGKRVMSQTIEARN